MSEGPTCSVVIPAYNAPATIGSAIESILAQTRANLELIVVDDGSRDETPEVVRQYERSDARVRLIEQANQGVAGARNTGITSSRGQFVSFLDNDDLWMPTYLEVMTAALEASPRAGFAYTDGWTLDDATKRIWAGTTMSGSDPPTEPPTEPASLMASLLRINYILSSATVRRAVLDEVGGFNPTLSGVDEYDLWLRIVAAGYTAARAPGQLVIQRERHDSQSKDEVMMARGLVDLLRDALANYELNDEGRAAARAQIDRWSLLADALSGAGGSRARIFRGRRALGRLYRALTPGPKMYDQPPPEVAAAFPDLSAPSCPDRRRREHG